MDVDNSSSVNASLKADAAVPLQVTDKRLAVYDEEQTDATVHRPNDLQEECDSPVSEEDLIPGGTAGAGHNFLHRMKCIEYPGIVKCDEKALHTLGGIESIGSAFEKRNRRMELRFRPDDYYCKPACASQHPATALLIKVKVKRRKQKPETTSFNVCEVNMLGTVDTVYQFKNMCDFQYIPTDGHENIYNSLMPHGIPPFSWLLEESEYFLPPAAFSRMDSMQLHLYSKEKVDSLPQHIIGCTRTKRAGHAIFVDFMHGPVPNEPRPSTFRVIHSKNIDGDRIRHLQQIFQQRPIWSKSGLMVESTLTKEQLKFVLPAVAYYFINGPWRIMWVRFGYDPRQHVESRNLQTLDFRLRTAGGLKSHIKAKRSYTNYVLPYKSAPVRPKVRIINRPDLKPTVKPGENNKEDTGYIFRPGTLPPSRQMFYQYCDLHVPEIQVMLEKLPSLPPNSKCHSQRGWMPPGIDDQCRNIINKLVLQKMMADIRNRENVNTDKGTVAVSPKPDPTPGCSSDFHHNEKENIVNEECLDPDCVDLPTECDKEDFQIDG